MAHGCTYCTDDFHCEKFTNEKCTSWCYGEGYPCKERRISNADRIRAMTDEELAEYLDGVCHDLWQMFVADPQKMWLDWLKQEVTANDS